MTEIKTNGLPMAKRQKIHQLWKDPAMGLTGVARFQRKLHNLGILVSKEDLKALLSVNPAHTLFTYYAKDKKWNTITETGVGHGMQMDLMDMSKIATRNKNFHWILCIIDVYSRYAWAFPLKRKTQTHVYNVLKAWLGTLTLPPRRMTSDAGTEFTSRKVKDLLVSYNITQYLNQTGDKTTTGIVERFNRTLRDLMGRNFVRLGKLQWVDDLPKLVMNYNQSRHSTLGATPDDVYHHRVEPKARPVRREQFLLQEGDRVRVLLPRGVFDKKAGAQRWSTTIYTVSRRHGFKYFIKNARNEELKTKYRPSALKKVTTEEETTITDSGTRIPLRQQFQHVANQRRRKRIARQLDTLPVRHRRVGFRPSTLRRRLRQARKKT